MQRASRPDVRFVQRVADQQAELYYVSVYRHSQRNRLPCEYTHSLQVHGLFRFSEFPRHESYKSFFSCNSCAVHATLVPHLKPLTLCSHKC